MKPRTPRAAALTTTAALAAALLAGCATATPLQMQPTTVTPDADAHIVIVANTPGPAAEAPNIDYLTGEITSRGLSIITLPEPGSDSESINDTIATTIQSL